MVAGPVTGAEGDEQTDRELPDLRLFPEFGIPAQRAEQTSGGDVTADGFGPQGGEGRPPRDPALAEQTSGDPAAPAIQGPSIPAQPGDPRPAPVATSASATGGAPLAAAPSVGKAMEFPVPQAAEPTERTPESGAAAVLGSVPPIENFPRQTASAAAQDSVANAFGGIATVEAGQTPAAGGEGHGGAGAGPDGGEPPRRPGGERRHRRSPMRHQTSTAIAFVACLAVAFLVLHRFVPDAGGLGSLLETWLPWVGVPVGVLLVAAAIVHTRRSVIATLAAALVWTALYGPTLLPRGSSAPAQLRVFSEDVNGKAKEATDSGSMALAQHADVVALEDMYSSVSASSAVDALNAAYPNHVTEYEFGLWSRYPISAVTPIPLGSTVSTQTSSIGADAADLAASDTNVPVIGALKATLATPHGALTVYLVHLPQPVVGDQGFAKARDVAFTQFVAMLKADKSSRLAVIGDINVAATDRQFSQLTTNDALTSAQQAAGGGFGFTWPAEFPFVRLDDVLTRGLTPLRSVVLPSIASGQTHLPIQVDLDY